MLIESIKLLDVHSQNLLTQLINHSNAEVIGNVENKSVKQKMLVILIKTWLEIAMKIIIGIAMIKIGC